MRVAAILPVAVLAFTLCAIPARADSLHGRVTDPDRLPIAGAQVLIFRAFALDATLTTNAAGRYGPIALQAAPYEVLAVARGYAMQPVAVTITAGTAVVTLDLMLTPSPASDYVVVSAPAGVAGIDALATMTRGITVFDRGEVTTLQASSLADVLRLAPGLQLQTGAAPAVSGWGGAPGDVLVIIDGVPQTLFGGTFNAALISAADIDHVDILRGAGSVMDGTRAASAVVRVTTIRPSPARLGIMVEGGREPSGHVTATAGHAGEEWTWHGDIDWLGTKGQNGRRTSNGLTVGNDDQMRANGSIAVSWQDRPDRSVRWQARADRVNRGVSGPWGADPLGVGPTVDLISRATGHTASSSVAIVLPTGEVFNHRLDASVLQSTSQSTGARDEVVSARRWLFRYHVDAHFTPQWLVTAGAEREWESATDSLVRNTADAEVALSRTSTSWFAEVRRSLGTRVTTAAGARIDVIDRAPLEGDTNAGSYRPALPRDARYQVNARGSATAILFRDTRGNITSLRAAAGTTTRPPTAEDIGFSENPGLRPERSRMGSAAIDSLIADGRVGVSAEGFTYRSEDLIVPFAVHRRGVRRIVTDNVAVARAAGATLTAHVTLPSHLLARGTLTWLDTRVIEAHCWCGDAPDLLPLGNGDQLVRRPRLAGAASLIWTRGRHSAFVTASGRGTMLDVEPTIGERLFMTPGFAVVSIGGSLAIRADVHVFARLTNLLDRRYEDVLGYPAPRRALVIGLRLSDRD